ncbi:hypothetical protein BJF78_26230 [Pseudonocardia sp. CNS-139]|nr:hypothetical protein BJF78_26230 [Pseudonocardia sp. CNS-139]
MAGRQDAVQPIGRDAPVSRRWRDQHDRCRRHALGLVVWSLVDQPTVIGSAVVHGRFLVADEAFVEPVERGGEVVDDV